MLARALALFAALAITASPVHADTITVFAAASLKGSLDEVAGAFERASGHKVRVSYGASSALARQIEYGAPVEIFISADSDWSDYLQARGVSKAGSRTNLLANDLVLIAPAASAVRLAIAPGFDLAGALGNGHLALADPRAVPAGKYARAALESLKAWQQVEGRIAPAETVRGALAYVARGDTPLGIVYRTDALVEKLVRIVDVFPPSSHPPIVYPLVMLPRAGRGALALRDFASGPAARAIWSRHGFRFPA